MSVLIKCPTSDKERNIEKERYFITCADEYSDHENTESSDEGIEEFDEDDFDDDFDDDFEDNLDEESILDDGFDYDMAHDGDNVDNDNQKEKFDE